MASADRLIEIFTEAKARPVGAERDHFLSEACPEAPELKEQVLALLQAHDEAGDYLKNSIAPSNAFLTEKPGDRIGCYKLLQQIGEGGCGVVYMAEQEGPVRRRVALKVIKLGMDTKSVIARFEAERQALALMDHPNIAKVFDAGATDTGRPFFVMELVRGIKITDYCDENNLSTNERLELFTQVCQAVQHAHQKGVIHRDLNPSNILVAQHDNVAVPKVIDFGLAKATNDQRLTDKTLFTAFDQFVGTPAYMSPEQAQMSGLDVDTRTDIYALGVLLYELLTGRTPFDAKELAAAGLDEMRRKIREQEPARPSTRLTQELVAADVRRLKSRDTNEAEVRASSCRLLRLKEAVARLRGDLDWIVMKCLEKDRTRRYATVNGLARDVERYLNHETVDAFPPSVAYRLRKLFRRHKAPVLSATLVLLALIAGMVGTTWGLIRATAARGDALKQTAQKVAALQAAQQSERANAEQLWQALVAQAWANRLSHRSGQRFETLDTLQRATQLARTLNLPAEKFHELRDAAIAALALPDLHLGGPWNPCPADTVAWDYDEAHALYARTDQQGNCSVRRVADDVELHHLPGQGGTSALVFSRDGKFLAVHHTDSKQGATVAVHLWQLEGATAQRLLAEEHARSPVFRDSKQFALAYADGSIRVFELPSGRQINRLAPDTLTREVGVAVHPTESVVAVWSYFELVVQIRDLETGKVLASLPQTDKAFHAAWHPDGRSLAVGYGESTVARLYDRATWEVQRTFEIADFGKLVAFNHRGDRLLMRGWGGMLELFDVGTGQKVWSMAHNSTDRFSRDDGRLAGAGRDGKLGIWKVADGREYRTLVFEALPDKGEYFPGAISPDGRWLAIPVTDGIGFWDLASGREVARLAMKGRSIRVLFEHSGSLLTLSREGLARWPVATAPDAAGHLQIGPPEFLPLPNGSALDQSRDGTVIVTCDRAVGSQQRHAGGWILHTDQPGPPLRLDPGADTYYIAVSPDGRWVFTVNHIDGGAKIWDARDGRMVRQFASGGIGSFTCGSSCFSPDSRWLRSGGDGNRLLAVGTWEPGPQVVSGFPTFAPDSRLMAVATSTGIQLFDSTTNRKVAMLEDPNLDLTIQALFVPDGTKLLAVTKARGIHVWDLRLIRQRLKELSLDWDWPDFPPATK